MPTEEELEKTYSQMATDDLLKIIARKGDYTDIAVDAANRQLQLRKVSPGEIKTTHAPEDPYKKLWMENCLYDLTFPEKAAFYFLWLPIGFIYRVSGYYSATMSLFDRPFNRPSWLSYKSSGFILKAQQSSLYLITGFVFFIASLIANGETTIGGGGVVFFTAWILGFGIVFLFDLYYNRQRLAGKLQEAVDAGELPWGV